jgi:hypothetical protein
MLPRGVAITSHEADSPLRVPCHQVPPPRQHAKTTIEGRAKEKRKGDPSEAATTVGRQLAVY